MTAITRMLNRLENIRAAIPLGPTAAELIMASRGRRLEASGQPFVPSPPVDYTGCRTIADCILRSRQAGQHHTTSPNVRTHDSAKGGAGVPDKGGRLNLKARLKTLERHQLPAFKEPLRIVVSQVGPLDLAKATCTRTMWPNGHLMEIVNLHGSDVGLSKDDLERFVQSFPVERYAR
jgi:hypothetical protein